MQTRSNLWTPSNFRSQRTKSRPKLFPFSPFSLFSTARISPGLPRLVALKMKAKSWKRERGEKLVWGKTNNLNHVPSWSPFAGLRFWLLFYLAFSTGASWELTTVSYVTVPFRGREISRMLVRSLIADFPRFFFVRSLSLSSERLLIVSGSDAS